MDMYTEYQMSLLNRRVNALERAAAKPVATLGQSLVYFQRIDTVEGTAYPLPITDGSQQAWRFLYRADLPPNTLLVGDVLEVTAEHELTNDAGFNTEVATTIVLSNGGQWFDAELNEGHSSPLSVAYLCRVIGGDVNTSAEHHRPVTRSGAIVIQDPAFARVATIIFKARARSTSANGNSMTIMGSGYGHMTIKVYR